MAEAPKQTLPWDERITVLSVHPDAASRDDVARLASELMECRADRLPACKWKQDEGDMSGVWWTDCGEGHVFEVDGPTENKMKFCCYCGHSLEEVPYVEPLDDEDEVSTTPVEREGAE